MMPTPVLVYSLAVIASTVVASPLLRPAQLDPKLAEVIRKENTVNGQVTDLGELESLHVVSITSHPSDSNLLLYADETAIYEFNKQSGESKIISGGESTGLLKTREPEDGLDARYKYITKIIASSNSLFIFDYDRLRNMDLNDKKVKTVAVLSDDQDGNNPITGAVDVDSSIVYWTTTAGEGHFIMSKNFAVDSEAELITAGPTLIGYMELSSDGRHLFASDVSLNMIERIDVVTGDVRFLSSYSTQKFVPGSLKLFNSNTLVAVDHASNSLVKLDLTESKSTPEPLCTGDCSSISAPFDFAVDQSTNQVFVLDTKPHPLYPTYDFSIKSIALEGVLQEDEPKDEKISREEIQRLIQYYSRFLQNYSSQ